MRGLLALRPTLLALPFLTLACCGREAPASRFPTADDALDRMHATYKPCNALKAFYAKFDDFAGSQRVRGDVSFFAARPDKIRLDVFAPSPVNTAIATLTSDGQKFALFDMREKRFLVGPATECNVQRLTKIPVPAHVMVELLMGEAPVLVHDKPGTSIGWSTSGFYVVRIPSKNEAIEELHLEPYPSDFAKPWSEQRIRVRDVQVVQQGTVLYHVEMDEHSAPPMDKPILPVVPGDPEVPLSGGLCTAEVPHKIKVEIPLKNEDVQFRYKDDGLFWNPPLQVDTFIQSAPAGMPAQRVNCQE